jgi:dTDP-4-amino-4,6-dideoxygalactose transaminase
MGNYRKISISTPSTSEEEWLALREPLDTGWLTQGPQVEKFEKTFAELHGVKKALATTSCTTAMHLMLAGLGIGPGDEVIVPSFTWVATANVVLYCGATPVLADVDPITYNINLLDVVSRITERTKAIIVVHLFGLCVDVPRLRELIPSDVLILEDCACAAGATLNGIPAGGLGAAGAFSFHPRKSITTGEGGMLTTNDLELANKLEILRNHGASMSEEERHNGSSPYLLPDFNVLGFNYRMTDIQGAIGNVQLGKLNGFISERQKQAEFYLDALSSIDWLRMPTMPNNGQHAWQSFVVFVHEEASPASRNVIMENLHSAGISSRPGTHAIHMLGLYKERFGYVDSDYPGAQLCNNQTMAIPLHNKMDHEDLKYVVTTLKSIK